MLQILFDRLGKRFKQGSLEARLPDGKVLTLGRGEPRAVIDVKSVAVLLRILKKPSFYFGETYMDGDWEPADGKLLNVFEAAMLMRSKPPGTGKKKRYKQVYKRLRAGLRELNTPLRSRRNVAHHYDLDASLYAAFLDKEMFYSCAYFREPDMTLEAAQQAKCAHIAAKLNLKPGARVLDIGCGWGGMAIYLAQHHGAKVTGITLSKEQLSIAKQRASERGLDGQLEFRLEDYRNSVGEYDAIVSVGMFEHVGRPQYAVFFQQVRALLAPEGVALIHTIGRDKQPGTTNTWLRKYIFPGGYIPAVSEVMNAIEPSKLLLTDLEVWRHHYGKTLAEWYRRFMANRSLFEDRFGERFCRMWEYYLQSSEASFYWDDLVVFHFQLTRRLDRLPITRDYLYP